MDQTAFAEIPRPDLPPIDRIDEEMASHPFSDSTYIIGRLHRTYDQHLQRLAPASELLARLRRPGRDRRYEVIGNVSVRWAVNAGLAAAGGAIREQEPHGIDAVLRLARERLDQPARGVRVPFRTRTDDPDAVLWRGGRTADAIDLRFDRLVADILGATLHAPTDAELDCFAGGLHLLGTLLPRLSRSALAHVHLVALFRGEGAMAGSGSCSDLRLSGAIFLNRSKARNPWTVAEHLFHEALHQQMYDFHEGHRMIASEVPATGRIRSLWNLPNAALDHHWGTWRALGAFHVYVHLALLASSAQQAAAGLVEEYGPVRMVGRRTACARARYLGAQLREHCWTELTMAGRLWVERFDAVLAVIDPVPPPEGAVLHLQLDRYRSEAHMVGAVLDRAASRQDAARRIDLLLRDEVEQVRLALAGIERAGLPEAPALEPGPTPVPDPAERFRQTRERIIATILQVSPDGGYSLHGADQTIGRMIDRSSAALQAISERQH